jgi:hypothetical protein
LINGRLILDIATTLHILQPLPTVFEGGVTVSSVRRSLHLDVGKILHCDWVSRMCFEPHVDQTQGGRVLSVVARSGSAFYVQRRRKIPAYKESVLQRSAYVPGRQLGVVGDDGHDDGVEWSARTN